MGEWHSILSHISCSVGERVGRAAEKASAAMEVVDSLKDIVSSDSESEISQKIERGIQTFAENIPWLMKGLDEVAKIHPVVTGMFQESSSKPRINDGCNSSAVVLAFKAVYYLESTRHDNDRRVTSLYVEMKDMMMVIVQCVRQQSLVRASLILILYRLRGVESRTHVGLDGQVIEDRL